MVVTDIHTLFLCEMKKDDDRGWIWNYSTKDKITHCSNSRTTKITLAHTHARAPAHAPTHARDNIYINNNI